MSAREHTGSPKPHQQPKTAGTIQQIISSTALNRGEWLNPLNRLIWQKAWKDKATQVVLQLVPPGSKKKKTTVFTCDYKLKPGSVWVAPVDNFAPCGWFVLDTVLSPLWVSEQK
jgi:hypothetical protein